jgi:hypothetical protein
MQSGKPIAAAKLLDFEKASQLVMGEARLSQTTAGPSSPKATAPVPPAPAKPQPVRPAAQAPAGGDKKVLPYYVAPSFDGEEDADQW